MGDLRLAKSLEDLKKVLPTLEESKGFNLADCDGFNFGRYPEYFNGKLRDEEIVWRVLDKASTSILAISSFALDSKPFDKDGNTNNWEDCSLKKWLNEDFYHQAFTKEEMELIEDTPSGKIFLLDKEEAEKYFILNFNRSCKPTRYAKKQGAEIRFGNCWWWLRSHGEFCESKVCTSYINIEGNIKDDGLIFDGKGAVRPALRLKI